MSTAKLPPWACEPPVSMTAFVPAPKRTCWKRFVPLLAPFTVTVTRREPAPARADRTVTGGRGLQPTGVVIVGATVGVGCEVGAGAAPPAPTAADALTRPYVHCCPVPATRSAVENRRATTD